MEPKRVFKQVGPSCFAYSLCGLIESRTDLKTDPKKFFREIVNYVGGKRPIKLVYALKQAVRDGIPLENGERFMLNGYRRVSRNKLFSDENANEFMVVAIDLEVGPRLGKRLDDNFVVRRRRAGTHAVYTLGRERIKEKSVIKIVNSWGEEFGNKGVCYASTVMQTNYKPFIMEAYRVIL